MLSKVANMLEPKSMSFRLVALTASIALAACMEPPEIVPTAVSSQDINGGSGAAGQFMATPIILARNAANKHVFTCTGELITPRVVMTAAHCANGAFGATHYEVHFCDKYDLKTHVFTGEVDTVIRTSQVVWFSPKFDETNLHGGHDIGLYYLDKPAPTSVKPYDLSRYRMNMDWVTRPMRLLGFGSIAGSGSDYGEKLTATTTISKVEATWFASNGAVQICEGDSGGPVLMNLDGRDVVAGINSFGQVAQCVSGEAGYTRVDAELDDIDAFIAANDPSSLTTARNCGMDGVCGANCTTVDPDCPCYGDGLCTTACPDVDLDPDCPVNCKKDNICQRNGCPVKDPDCGDKAVGAACAANNDCMTSLCVAKVCAAACNATTACGSGFTCTSNVCLKEDGGGGGCATVAGSSGGSGSGGGYAGLLALGAALLVARRRRRG